MVKTIPVDDLYKIAKDKTRKLTPVERRRVIVYINELGEYHSNVELAKLFDVDEKVIRGDKRRVLAQFAKSLTAEHAMELVARFMAEHDELVWKAKVALAKVPVGSLPHQTYLRILSDLEERKMKTMQGVGVIPKELGRLTITEEKWVARVEDDIPSVSLEEPGHGQDTRGDSPTG